VPVQVPLGQVAVHSYDEQTASRRRRASAPASTLPSAGEAEALLDLNRDLFTDDAWQGMQRRAAQSRSAACPSCSYLSSR